MNLLTRIPVCCWLLLALGAPQGAPTTAWSRAANPQGSASGTSAGSVSPGGDEPVIRVSDRSVTIPRMEQAPTIEDFLTMGLAAWAYQRFQLLRPATDPKEHEHVSV